MTGMLGRGRDFSGSVMTYSQSSSIPLVDPDLLKCSSASHFFTHLLVGVKVKGRVLMMLLADDQRDVPEVHGVSEVARPIAARPTP